MPQLREFQKNSIRFLSPKNRHLICISPTGSGKSRIYEELCAKKKMRILILTPLIALARQQEHALLAMGIPATRGSPSEQTQAWILSPESLQFNSTQSSLRRYSMDLLVVDECHCLGEWGELFRPAFADIPDLIERYQIPRSLWLTATLPPDDLQNLKSRLPKGVVHSGGFELPHELHLSFLKIPLSHRPSQLLDFLAYEKRPGVVFTPSRATAEKVSRLIEMTGRKSIFYHAGLSTEERKNKEHVISEQSPVVVATSAFGMGVHYPLLRWALCYHAPSSPLALAQSLGRAGRQGLELEERTPPRAIVFWDEDDFRLIEWVAGNSARRKAALMATQRVLNSHGCRRVALQAYFDTPKTTSFSRPLCQNCDFCTNTTI